MKRKKVAYGLLGLLILGVISLIGWNFYQQQKMHVSTDDAAIDGQAIVLRPKIQGYVKNVYVKDNEVVKAGDVILEIDSTDYCLKVKAAEAKLAMTQAALAAGQSDASREKTAAPAKAAAAQKKIGSARAAWDKAVADRNRMEMLVAGGACSQEEYEHTVSAENAAKAVLDSTIADAESANTASDAIAAAENTSAKLEADVKQAEAELEQTQQDLQNTKIIAPTDGRITKRSVETGSYVSSGTQLCSLVTPDLWVTANFKESQLNGIHPGDKVDIAVDAFPEMHLIGTVDSFQAGTGAYFSLFPAENATGNFVKTTQRVPVKICLQNISDEEKALLGPGMSVVPTVHLQKEPKS
jgi:membrane fusion protein, multidrug efflux system